MKHFTVSQCIFVCLCIGILFSVAHGLTCYVKAEHQQKVTTTTCYGSCFNMTASEQSSPLDVTYGCSYTYYRDDCRKLGDKRICFCNTYLCNLRPVSGSVNKQIARDMVPNLLPLLFPKRQKMDSSDFQTAADDKMDVTKAALGLSCYDSTISSVVIKTCNGSCAVITKPGFIHYACLPQRYPDGCQPFIEGTKMCVCNTDLCVKPKPRTFTFSQYIYKPITRNRPIAPNSVYRIRNMSDGI